MPASPPCATWARATTSTWRCATRSIAALVAGPRILAATLPLGATGGHADGGTGFAPNIEFRGETGVADGVDAVRARVREDVKHGADVIKFMASAGVLSNEASVGAPQYSQAEMDAIVDEAHRWEQEGRRARARRRGDQDGDPRRRRFGRARQLHR